MRSTLRVPVVLALLMCIAPPALGQSDRIAELESQVRRLTAELQQARRRVDELERTLETVREDRERLARELREARAGGGDRSKDDGGNGEGGATATAPIPEDPMASPASLLRAVRERYQEDLGSLADMPRTQKLGATRSWCRDVEREYRGRFEWLTKITGIREGDRRDYFATVQVLDRETRKPIGEAFEVELPGRVAGRIEREEDQELWWLSGRMQARLTFNIERPEEGPFDVPVFVGPYCEYERAIMVQGATPYLPPPDIPEQPNSPDEP